jgi:hypothetical protein
MQQHLRLQQQQQQQWRQSRVVVMPLFVPIHVAVVHMADLLSCCPRPRSQPIDSVAAEPVVEPGGS